MDLVSPGPLRTASLVWQPRAGLWTLTLVCKATFELRPGESPLAEQQDLPNEDDNYWDDDRSRSLYSPADLVPFKPRADVLLVGSAYAPHKKPVRSIVARLAVGPIRKAIEVHGDRTFGPDGMASDRAKFTKMRLLYERAAGGPETWNPVGVRLDGAFDPQGAIPNLVPPGTVISRRGDSANPIGFGPIAPTWPERRACLGRHAGSWPGPRWNERPVPEDIDRGYFNVAPHDQQVDALREDERIVLENLHPEHPQLVTALPGLRPRAIVERHGAPPADVLMTADTLWIDTDRGIVTLTWRGQVRLGARDEPGRITLMLDARGGAEAVATMMPFGQGAPIVPFIARPAEESPMARPSESATVFLDAHPELEEVSVDEEMTGGGDAGQGSAIQTMLLGAAAVTATKTALPFTAPAPSHAPAPLPAPPPVVYAAPMEPIAPAPKSNPWSASNAGPQPRLSVGEQAVAPPAPIAAPPPMHAGGGAIDASNAAAGVVPYRAEPVEAPPSAPVEPKPRSGPREVTKLLWFDPKAVARVRKHAEWRVILAELELRLLDEGDDDDAEEPEDGPSPKDRRDVFEVLTKGRSIEADGVRLALQEAISDDGKFDPPLVLVAGELELPFDELETLKATAAALAPFSAGDPKLKEQLDAVGELLKTPYLAGSAPMAEGMTTKLKEAFSQGKRPMPPGYVESNTERMLLEQRSYQRRTVFGKRWIRAVLRGGGMPVYVPEDLKDELPMFRRFRVRLIGEVDLQEDQYEPAGCAVKVVALGRVISG